MKILFLSKDILFPVDSGGKIRTSNILKQLNKVFELDVISLIGPGEEKFISDMKKLCKNFIYLNDGNQFEKNGLMFYLRVVKNLFSFYPYTMENDFRINLKKEIEKIANNYDLFICDFLFPAINCTGVKVPKILFQHNVEFMIYKRNAENTKGIIRFVWWLQYLKTKRIEAAMAKKFDFVICVSENDMIQHQNHFNINHVDFVDLGVDVEDYMCDEGKNEEKSIIFTGSMDWTPNDDAVRYFNDEILPLLEGYKFYAVGKNPSDSLKRLESENLIITGRVSDIKPYLNRGKVFIVPLRVGGGTRIKIFEAMAAKIPVVSTTIGAEGLPVKDNENILIRDTPKGIAEAIINLSTNSTLHNKIANNAFNMVAEKYSWKTVTEKFIKICDDVVKEKE